MMNTTTVCPHGYRLPAESCPSCQADRTMRELHELRADISRLKADAELGELVRRMPEGWGLHRVFYDFPLPGTWEVRKEDGLGTHWHDDPGEALREALREALGEGEEG